MSDYHLAQLNIARLKHSLDSPQLVDFVNNLERINALADQAAGFVWRLQTEQGGATDIDYFGNGNIVNMSVWEDMKSLQTYVYRSAHANIMSQRRQWFDKLGEAYNVLWWVSAGHIPDLDEAGERLSILRSSGPTQAAFTFKRAFTPQGMKINRSVKNR